jgi:hypothetical protein
VSLLREAAPVVAASILARGAFVWFKGSARSVDLEAWKSAGDLLAHGRNPYAEPGFFVWPPLWVQILWVLQKVSTRTGLSLIWIVPIFLVVVETVLIIALVYLLRYLGYAGRRRLVLLGIALNPVCIILVCQHGNSTCSSDYLCCSRSGVSCAVTDPMLPRNGFSRACSSAWESLSRAFRSCSYRCCLRAAALSIGASARSVPFSPSGRPHTG